MDIPVPNAASKWSLINDSLRTNPTLRITLSVRNAGWSSMSKADRTWRYTLEQTTDILITKDDGAGMTVPAILSYWIGRNQPLPRQLAQAMRQSGMYRHIGKTSGAKGSLILWGIGLPSLK